MADPEEERRFAEIVAEFRAQRRRRLTLLLGVLLCLAAVALVALGGINGAVLAVLPWVLGIIIVVRSRSWH